jgi:nucleoside-diphosphate-sugar epimerase
MRILVAGASGALGRRLVPLLVANGHDVTGFTRSREKVPLVENLGAAAIVVDVLDAPVTRAAVDRARPDTIVSLLTNLPQRLDLRRINQAYAANNRVRVTGVTNLVAGAITVGVTRLVVESLAIWYAPFDFAQGRPEVSTRDELAPLFVDAPEPVGTAVRALIEMERIAQQAPLSTIILRYGGFYGPGTWLGRGGFIYEDTLKRKYPLLGDGAGYYSWIHIDDAATATVAAIESDRTGIFNVVDDEPSPSREWLPYYAETIGGPVPRTIPLMIARFVGGGLVDWQNQIPPVSNARIKQVLGWKPAIASWREGFRSGL